MEVAASYKLLLSVSVREGMILNQQDNMNINSSWILLNIETTGHNFCNSKLLTNIRLCILTHLLAIYM